VALVLGSGLGLGATCWALRGPLATAELLAQFAFVGVVNRICTYHNGRDDLLLVFALVWLGRRAWVAPEAGHWPAFLALGLTMWAPTAALQFSGANALLVVTWAAVAGWLLLRSGGRTAVES
jgi:hypothetical protein